MCKRAAIALTLVLLLLQPTVSWGQDDPLDTYQERARALHRPGVDEDALLDRAFIPAGELLPGMFAPDFTLMDLDGVQHRLSDLRGQKFVVIHTGNAT